VREISKISPSVKISPRSPSSNSARKSSARSPKVEIISVQAKVEIIPIEIEDLQTFTGLQQTDEDNKSKGWGNGYENETTEKDKREEVDRSSSSSPSSSLMKMTQSRAADMKAVFENHGKIKHEDDIWWEARGSKYKYEKLEKKVIPVESKLAEPTKSFLNSTRGKLVDEPIPSRKSVKQIALDSPLLKPRTRVAWESPHKANQSALLTRVVATNGPKNVKSRVYNGWDGLPKNNIQGRAGTSKITTTDKENNTSNQLNTAKAVTKTSERVLKYNACMNASKQNKFQNKAVDNREAGWNNTYAKSRVLSTSTTPSPRSPFLH